MSKFNNLEECFDTDRLIVVYGYIWKYNDNWTNYCFSESFTKNKSLLGVVSQTNSYYFIF